MFALTVSFVEDLLQKLYSQYSPESLTTHTILYHREYDWYWDKLFFKTFLTHIFHGLKHTHVAF